MHASTPSELIEAGGHAVYTAKAAGKNYVRQYNLEMNPATVRQEGLGIINKYLG